MKVKGNYAGVSTDYVKKMIDKKADMILVDSRPKRKKYDKGHIPTAISISDSQFDKLKGQLPQDKNKPLVFYCGGFKCELSHKSAARAINLGYTNVKVFAAGYPACHLHRGGTGPLDHTAHGRSFLLGAGPELVAFDLLDAPHLAHGLEDLLEVKIVRLLEKVLERTPERPAEKRHCREDTEQGVGKESEHVDGEPDRVAHDLRQVEPVEVEGAKL